MTSEEWAATRSVECLVRVETLDVDIDNSSMEFVKCFPTRRGRKEVTMAHFKVQSGPVIASPNVIPMADIMLVLLIIFMVVTPLIQIGVPVDLVKVTNPIEMPNADKDDAVIVAISPDGSVFLGNTKMAVDDLSSRVSDRISNRLDETVFIKSDARTKYGDVVRVVDKVRSSGVDNVGLLTDKTEPQTPPLPL
jgi:biopolymer transport protein TolR